MRIIYSHLQPDWLETVKLCCDVLKDVIFLVLKILNVETLPAFYFSNNLYHRDIVSIDSSRNIQKNACGKIWIIQLLKSQQRNFFNKDLADEFVFYKNLKQL